MNLVENARLSESTTFRLGGICPLRLDCATEEDVVEAIRYLAARRLPWRLLGGGSNVLVADQGIDEAVIRFVIDGVVEVHRTGTRIAVSGATPLDALAEWSVQHGLEGLATCSGIPGTVGGAVVGNAGAFGEQIGDRVVDVITVDRHGQRHHRSPSDLGFAYRSSRLPELGEVVVSVVLDLALGSEPDLSRRREDILDLRRQKHPDWKTQPTAGSFFKNIEPTSKAERRQAAGWFLEQAGALTFREGGARTFERHANIILAESGCHAEDVVKLARRMADAVKAKFDLDLVPEVKGWGVDLI